MNAATTDPAILAALATLYTAVAGVFVAHRVEMPTPPPTPRRSKLVTAILDALGRATAPMRAKDLARATGHKANGHLRNVASQLKAEGLVLKVRGGYIAAPPS